MPEATPEDVIASKVKSLNGCKSTELVSHPEIALLRTFTPDLIDKLVNKGDLIEIEYVLPDFPWRIKSFLLPKGTKIMINGECVVGCICGGEKCTTRASLPDGALSQRPA